MPTPGSSCFVSRRPDLIEEMFQLTSSEQTPFRGMSVHIVHASFPVYQGQSEIPVNNAGNDVPSLTPGSRFIQQVCPLGSGHGTREPAKPAGYSDPGHPLNTLPVVPSNPQTYRPVAVVKPLNLNQTTTHKSFAPAEEIIDNNDYSANLSHENNIDSRIFTDPADSFATDIAEIPQSILDEYVPWDSDNEAVEAVEAVEAANDTPSSIPHNPEDLVYGNSSIVEHQREHNREHRRKLCKDAAYLECVRARRRERQRKLCQDPAYAERERARKREWQRKLYQDPVYAERERTRKRERQRKLRQDPAYLKLERERYRKRYRDNLAFAERERIRKRECYWNSQGVPKEKPQSARVE